MTFSFRATIERLMGRCGFVPQARFAEWKSPAEVARLIEAQRLKDESTILLASQAKTYSDMYKTLLETSTQERIKFFEKDPRGLYRDAMQQLIVGQQFASAFEAWRAEHATLCKMLHGNAWGNLVESSSAFHHALSLALPR